MNQESNNQNQNQEPELELTSHPKQTGESLKAEMLAYLESFRGILVEQAAYCERVCDNLMPFLEQLEKQLNAKSGGGDGWLDFVPTDMEPGEIKLQRATLDTMRAAVLAMRTSASTTRLAIKANVVEAIRIAHDCLQTAQCAIDDGRRAFTAAFVTTGTLDQSKIEAANQKAQEEIKKALLLANESIKLQLARDPNAK